MSQFATEYLTINGEYMWLIVQFLGWLSYQPLTEV